MPSTQADSSLQSQRRSIGNDNLGFERQRILNRSGADYDLPVSIGSCTWLTDRAEEEVQDLDWTTTSDRQSVLAVGFRHHVSLVCEQRMSYSESTPGWAPFLTIDLTVHTSMAISDSIWLAGGSLAIGAGNQIYVFSRFIDRDAHVSSPTSDLERVVLDTEQPEDLFQLIAWRNGPLLDYHPTVLSQCLLWGKSDLVKSILLKLLADLGDAELEDDKKVAYKRLDPLDFCDTRKVTKTVAKNVSLDQSQLGLRS